MTMSATNRRFTALLSLVLSVCVLSIAWVMLSPSAYAETSQEQTQLVDGDVVKTATNPDVYILKITSSGAKYKRLIINPDIFESYGHLRWENIKTISPTVMDEYKTSTLVRSVVDGILYELFPEGDGGTKRIFLSDTYDADSVFSINQQEVLLYATVDNTPTTPPTTSPSSQHGVPSVSMATPTGLNLTLSGTDIILSWNAVSGATEYVLAYCGGTISCNDPTKITVPGATTYTLAMEQFGILYSFSIYARSASAFSLWSDWLSIGVRPEPPVTLETPTNVRAVRSENQANLSWDLVVGATEYVVLYCGGDVSCNSPQEAVVSRPEYTVPLATSYAQYSFSVLARTDNRFSSWSPWVSLTTVDTQQPVGSFDTPTGFVATVSGTHASLSWNAVNTATGYVIAYCGGSIDCSAPRKVSTEATTYRVPLSQYNAVYSFAVLARRVNTFSAYTNWVRVVSPARSEVLDAPSNLNVTVAGTNVVLSWSTVSGAKDYVIAYCGGSILCSSPQTLSVSGSTYVFPLTSTGVQYSFAVLARNDGVLSPYTDWVRVNT